MMAGSRQVTCVTWIQAAVRVSNAETSPQRCRGQAGPGSAGIIKGLWQTRSVEPISLSLQGLLLGSIAKLLSCSL